MLQLMRPEKLKSGDRIAAVSPSWGGAGDAELLWRYNLGKARLQQQFGLQVVEMPHTLCGSAYVYAHPQKRAEDLMQAFADPEIKGIFACIGGDDSIRMLPYIDFEVMRQNPKVVLGYSDTTTLHLMCVKAGFTSFYGPSILAEFAENVEIFPYTVQHFEKAVFSGEAIGQVLPPAQTTGERVEWLQENENRRKTMQPHGAYEVLQGNATVRGPLLGGCIEVLEMSKGTPLFPPPEAFDGALLFFETSEDMPPPTYLEYWLRNYAVQGLLQRAGALLFGRPYQGVYYNEYKASILKIMGEFSLENLPVFYNLPFGHNEPMCTLPYGAMAEVDTKLKAFSILQPGVL
ncbi:LD-carboxypeptidase [Ruminococcaceae bacterium OttesenSCG-928-N02]|nr:LD-carboxypeptidase [Ruminococcaceae bacterium OttesenSCG-928-N02]